MTLRAIQSVEWTKRFAPKIFHQRTTLHCAPARGPLAERRTAYAVRRVGRTPRLDLLKNGKNLRRRDPRDGAIS